MKFFRYILLLIVLLLAACSGGNDEEGAEEGTSNDSSDGASDEVLTIGNSNDIVSFDIHDHNNTSTEAVHVNMFNYLVKNDPDEGFIPDLAESWENVDETKWEFKLKEGVKFHNGDELTAEDVKFTLERVANDSALLEYGAYRQIEEVEVVSDYEFVIHTYEPEPALLNRVSRIGSGILPKNYIETEGWDVFLENPVGTGPYQFEEWQKDSQLTLTRFDDYFGDEPKWSQVEFRAIPENSTRVSELLTGGIDLAVNIPPDDIERIESSGDTTVMSAPSQRVMLFVLRTQGDYPTADPKVREAIELAIDKEAIIESVLEGHAVPTRTRVTPGNFGANEELYDTQLYDPERARELLEEAGYADGVNIKLSSPSGRYLKDRESVELMVAMLQEVGINADVEFLEWSAFSTPYSNKEFEDVFFIAYGNSMFDGSQALQRLELEMAAGETDYDNPEVEELLSEAMNNMDEDSRLEQYQKAQEIISEDRPIIPLFQVESIYGVNDRINFEPELSEMLYVDDITIK